MAAACLPTAKLTKFPPPSPPPPAAAWFHSQRPFLLVSGVGSGFRFGRRRRAGSEVHGKCGSLRPSPGFLVLDAKRLRLPLGLHPPGSRRRDVRKTDRLIARLLDVPGFARVVRLVQFV